MMTNEDVLLVLDHAAATGNFELLDHAYAAAHGLSRRYAFSPVSQWRRDRGREACAVALLKLQRPAS